MEPPGIMEKQQSLPLPPVFLLDNPRASPLALRRTASIDSAGRGEKRFPKTDTPWNATSRQEPARSLWKYWKTLYAIRRHRLGCDGFELACDPWNVRGKEWMYDVVIVGSGPAGANLARLIGNSHKVLLLDRRTLEGEAPPMRASKCCGGLLAPDAQKMIAKLGLGVPKDVLVNPQLFAVRTIDLANRLERLYQRFYFNMDRDRFDRWLVSLIPAGVEKRFNACFKGFSEIPGGYEVRYSEHGQGRCARARVLVGADGAFSKVRRCLGADANPPERYVSIQEWFECPDTIPYFTAIFDEEISDFYSWIIPKEGCILLGAALRPGDQARQRFERLKAKLTPLGFHFDRKTKAEGAYLCRPRKGAQFHPGRDGVALVGEAAGAISPSSAEGISYAFKSSLYLAQSLEEGIDGFLNRYQRSAGGIRRNLFLKNLKSPAMYCPPLRRLVMQSGLQSIR